MNKHGYDSLQATLGRDILAFLPELILCATIVLMLLLRLFSRFDRRHMGGIAFILTAYALLVSVGQWLGYGIYDPRADEGSAGYGKTAFDLFSGLLVYDNFTI